MKLAQFSPRPPSVILWILAWSFLFLALHSGVLAQESSSRPADAAPLPENPISKLAPPASVPANSPAAALRDILLAACAQNGNDFSRFLTARSKESFEQLTPPARISLMKRLVLLNVPGKATSSANPSGRPVVLCETPDVTTEMTIGGAELRDNVAFLPMDLHDIHDTSGTTARHVNIGVVREHGQWRLLSLGLLLLDLPALEVEWDAAETDANEATALENLKKLAEAVESYRRTYTVLPESLSNLGPAQSTQAVARSSSSMAKLAIPKASRETAGLIDADLASGNKDGYTFRIVIAGSSTVGAPAKYELAATPSSYGRTGNKSFLRDTDGKFHVADHRGGVGSEADPEVK